MNFQGPGQDDSSILNLAPEPEQNTDRVRAFFRDILSYPGFGDTKLQVNTQGMPKPTAPTDNLLMMGDEEVIQDVRAGA